jgi:hypothetical protein
MREAKVTVNGIELTSAQVSALRGAVTGFRIELSDPEYRRRLGPIAEAYDARLAEVESLLVQTMNESDDTIRNVVELGLVDAVKRYRIRHQTTLKDAKLAVDTIIDQAVSDGRVVATNTGFFRSYAWAQPAEKPYR